MAWPDDVHYYPGPDNGSLFEFRVSGGYLQARSVKDPTWSNVITIEAMGVGVGVRIRSSGGYIQYSVDSGSTWQNIITTASLKGEPGSNGTIGITPTLRVNGGYIQFSVDEGSNWTNLVALADLKGEPGEPGPAGSGSVDGMVLKDSATPAHYWLYEADTDGRLIITDTGTTPP